MLCATCCTETYARGLHSPLRSGCLATLSLTSFHNFHSASHKECREERRCGTELFSTHAPNQSCSVSSLFRVLTAFHGRPHGRCTACAPSQSTTPGSSFPPKNDAGTLFGKHLLSFCPICWARLPELVETTRIELATSCLQGRHATAALRPHGKRSRRDLNPRNAMCVLRISNPLHSATMLLLHERMGAQGFEPRTQWL